MRGKSDGPSFYTSAWLGDNVHAGLALVCPIDSYGLPPKL
jgi:hypothetical protein